MSDQPLKLLDIWSENYSIIIGALHMKFLFFPIPILNLDEILVNQETFVPKKVC